ncbi:putative FAD-dependent oxidoreductase [Escherichia coli]|uniref:Protein FixC n=1 Tax=Escherichia coli TaxID=562 RepID=A0A2X1MQH6_ECOLX|nr:putative FAD-dependent oxidoreductase [Escherichia coli]STM16724.1 putative FAD-dependent oxidoreductase [Escherichia coli]
MEDDCDIIIIGAGIAGTACALHCARAGLSVLLLERAEIPGSKNLSGGRLYTHALAELLPQFHLTAPLERRITHESLSLLTPDGATTFSSLQPGGESWSVLRARFDPWLVAEAEKEGVECIPGATVDALYEENGRVCGIICGDDILRARYVVLAEGANSVLAERHGLVTRPAGEAMALGIKEVLSLETSAIEERFHLENNEGAALLFSGRICDDLPGGAFLYTNQQTLSLGIVCPLSSLTQSRVPASELLARFKRIRQCARLSKTRNHWSMVRIWCQKVACTVCQCNTPVTAGCWWAMRCAVASIAEFPCAVWIWRWLAHRRRHKR